MTNGDSGGWELSRGNVCTAARRFDAFQAHGVDLPRIISDAGFAAPAFGELRELVETAICQDDRAAAARAVDHSERVACFRKIALLAGFCGEPDALDGAQRFASDTGDGGMERRM